MLELLDDLTARCAYEYPFLLPTLFALLGLSIGSYLNVVIYRMPRGLSTNEPKRSFCPRCNKIIPWYLNIPVLSWLCLRGKSACCHQRISPRYLFVELLTGGLFVWVSFYYSYESVLAQALICLWLAVAIAIFFIDWEQMIVLPRLCLVAAGVGLLLSVFAPSFCSDGAATGAQEGIIYSALGACVGFVLFKAIALLGRAAFGRKKQSFASSVDWVMHSTPDENDIELIIDGKSYLWSELFFEASHRLILKDASLNLKGREPIQGDLTMSLSHITLPDGQQIALSDYDAASGTCCAWEQQREAMGSGDAWIALAIGAFCGWQGVAVTLVAGSLLGLIWALVTRVSRGEPMPFGPCLLLGTGVYMMDWHQVIWNYYLSLF
ncbi:MAG: prepilin peptidase [Akkermansia sp.]